MSDTIDKTTKVNLGILGTLIAMAWLGATKLSDLSSEVKGLRVDVKEVKQALDRNSTQIANDGKSSAVMGSRLNDIERRVLELERSK